MGKAKRNERQQNENKEIGHEKGDTAPYLVVDYGAQLTADMEHTRDEIHKQMLSVIEGQSLLWEVVRYFIILTISILAGLGMTVFYHLFLPHWMSTIGTTVFFGVTVGFGYLSQIPMNEAINRYLSHTIYTPQFIDCICHTCEERRGQGHKGQEAEVMTPDVTSAENVGNSGEVSSTQASQGYNNMDVD